jgi:hypothetical protein
MLRPLVVEYTAYHSQYIEHVPYGDPLVALERQAEDTARMLLSLSEERGNYRYAPGKWSIKEVVGHVIDTERIFTYRCLAIARGDSTSLPGFDQDAYVARACFEKRSLQSLASELRAVRAASLALYRSLGEEEWSRAGVANGKHLTARVFPWIAAGHEHHHLQVLRERYLGSA